MQPHGRAAIDLSKELGLWHAAAAVDALIVPDELRNALRLNPAAEQFFDEAAPSYRRNVLRRISAAKKPETRGKRVDITVALSAGAEKVPQM